MPMASSTVDEIANNLPSSITPESSTFNLKKEVSPMDTHLSSILKLSNLNQQLGDYALEDTLKTLLKQQTAIHKSGYSCIELYNSNFWKNVIEKLVSDSSKKTVYMAVHQPSESDATGSLTDVVMSDIQDEKTPPKPKIHSTIIEILSLLLVGFISRNQVCIDSAIGIIEHTRMHRHLDLLLARCHYVRERIIETEAYSKDSLMSDDCSSAKCKIDFSSARAYWTVAMREAKVLHADETTGVLLNAILRSLIRDNEWASAERLLLNSNSVGGSPSVSARRAFYAALISANSGDYSSATDLFLEAQSKANPKALGFHASIVKYSVVVALLIGEIPARSSLEKNISTQPYLSLANSVRLGNLERFETTVTQYAEKFKLDGTIELISRLPTRVIQAGVLRIGLAYRRISLEEVQNHLRLPNLQATFDILCKVISDKLIAGKVHLFEGQSLIAVSDQLTPIIIPRNTAPDNTINSVGWLECIPSPMPYYESSNTQLILNDRIRQANQLHDTILRSMRYADSQAALTGVSKSGEDGPTEAELLDEFMDGADMDDDLM